ncbi:hyaluronidase-1-like [Nerophis lumbriciformis]|uniref:hyaluronidase-1-like n=1 Tax=Nerophis lumbriciformis TaxID=546530 RepID=UPI002AE07543|nr:hyaluronidase-1-like [Nerophis lumbriciformis]XP_061780668.1 hyaluronidase-1-like [Nerophis lumbriciformis]XP_061780669.1 hyaluronidase-1-like [Nerophis lumbriciformis]XP_061780671.1 hyaluronidase-1-like [Nerophis lumbriciformis]
MKRFLTFAIIIIEVTVAIDGEVSAAVPPSAPPLIPDHPFVAVWNAPLERCLQLGVPLDTAAFQAVTTTAPVPGQFLTIFYEDRLGIYPKVDPGRRQGGGVPQNGNLTAHLLRARGQIERLIPEDESPGLAVIDWESWRPLWAQNWGSKRVYQKLSLAAALQTSPFLPMKKVSQLAADQFQRAGRRFMERTIALGEAERPSRSWGFYSFPYCHNYDWDQPGYTGVCSARAHQQNQQLMWLWERSTALFPSIYLHPALRDSPRAALYARHRVREALRVAALPERPYAAPTYVYSRPLYRGQTATFESQVDLVNTVGESAALGAAGVVMWGGTRDYDSKSSCQSLSDYLTSTLNPYLANVTAAAMLCGRALCQGRGRCVRKSFDSSHYLHLDSAHFRILRSGQKYVAVGLPSARDLDGWARNFTCQCFVGHPCSPRLAPPRDIQIIQV